MACHIIVMGVSGCGKTTVGKALAKRLGYPWHDGDNYHPAANIEKMRQGTPLTDADRQGWLETLNRVLLSEEKGAVLACSALKPEYRKILSQGVNKPVFVYLRGSFSVIWGRYKNRKKHFFQGKEMLKSQFATLVEPEGDNVITVSVTLRTKSIVEIVCHSLQSGVKS